MDHWDDLEPGRNYAINRARLYRDRRDFVIQTRGHRQARGLPGESRALRYNPQEQEA